MNPAAFKTILDELTVWLAQLDDAQLRSPAGGNALQDRSALPATNPLSARLHTLPFVAGMSIRRATSALSGAQLCLSLTDPVPSCHSLCRTALDTVARPYWILDPACSPTERGERTISVESAARREQRKLVLQEPGLLAKADAEKAAFDAELAAAGITAMAVPGYTHGVGQLLSAGTATSGEGVYRALSAATHGSWHGVSAAPVFTNPLSLAGAATLGVLDTFARLVNHIDWPDAGGWYRWASGHRGDLI